MTDPSPAPTASGHGAVTVRAVVVGLLGGGLLAALGYINDSFLRMTHAVGNSFPVFVYGSVAVGVLAVNPLLRRLRPSLALRGGEWAIALTMMLASAAVATNGLMRCFLPTLAMPAQHYSLTPSWQKHRVMQYVAPGALLGDGDPDAPAVQGYLVGLGQPGAPIGLADVPWQAWLGPLATWLPIVAVTLIVGLCLTAIVQRQWAQRELLAFPLAQFVTMLLRGRTRTLGGFDPAERPFWRRGGFWMAVGAAFGLHLINGLAAWYPGGIQIPRQLDFLVPISQKFPRLGSGFLAANVFSPTIYLAVVGFSFFLARDVSFSLGIYALLYQLVATALLIHGINLHAGPSGGQFGQTISFLSIGAYAGLAAMVLYAGRAYYLAVLRRALGLRGRDGGPLEHVGTMRIFLLACAVLAALLTRLGIDGPFAVVLVLVLVLIFLTTARICAETGLFYYAPPFWVADSIAALFGVYAVGPRAILMAMIFTKVITADARVMLPPLIINGLEVCRTEGVPVRRAARWAAVMLAVAVPLAVVVVLYASYNLGVSAQRDTWALNRPPTGPFNVVTRALDELSVEGRIDRSVGLSTFERLGAAQPLPTVLPLIATGAAIVVLLSVLRLRLPWWPIHPILMIVWGGRGISTFSFSFLLGWFVRVAVGRIAGERACQQAKPILVGLIVGELLAGLMWMAVGWVYYLATDRLPEVYRVYPG